MAQIAPANPISPSKPEKVSDPDASKKYFNGAEVHFGPGAEIVDLKLASDFSTIQILQLPENTGSEFIVDLLQNLGFTVPQSVIQLKNVTHPGGLAEVRIQDPDFAAAVVKKFNTTTGINRMLSVKQVLGNSSLDHLGNKLRMSSVTCTWYAASQVAWLQYDNAQNARNAEKVLKAQRLILNRKIECSIQTPPMHVRRNPIWSIQVGNLDVLTKKSDFNRILHGTWRPKEIVFSRPSHWLSETEAAKAVESLLRSKGNLESFQVHAIPGSVKLKATATFMCRDQAVEAVQSLNDTKIQVLGNSKIFINHLISIKYNVLTIIHESILADLRRLRDDIWADGHTHLKSYASLNPLSPITTVRVFGEDPKRVAEAKAALEKLLAGSIVKKGETALWDAYFAAPAALLYLKQQSTKHNLYIHRDNQKSQLILYGGSANEQVAAQESLIAKLESLQRLTHTIVLTAELLPKAMKGGMRRLKEKFGKAAVLDISRQPKTISIQGSATDLLVAKQLLLQNDIGTATAETSNDNENCPVCWDVATEPVKTKCGHGYCKECFSLQASSADTNSFPLRCCAAEGSCLHAFGMQELESLLPTAIFLKLLQRSFDAFILSHPQDLAHCPTPGCPQLYRPTTTSSLTSTSTSTSTNNSRSIFLCPSCLTPICTTCAVIAHDGLTCAEFKDLSSEGYKLLEKWKKENDARPCPKCKVLIQKTFGCNHMACVCGAHICWFCMEVFATGEETYPHMRREHGNYYAGGFGAG